jgi:aminopeptidase N
MGHLDSVCVPVCQQSSGNEAERSLLNLQDLDGLENSHPIEVEVYSSAEIDEIFDAISYSKGASVGHFR